MPTSAAVSVITSHLGYLCGSRKRIVVPVTGGAQPAGFVIQDMARNAVQAMSGEEDWTPVLHGGLTLQVGPWGPCLIGDFSRMQVPGIYRAVVDGVDGGRSFQFAVADGVAAGIPNRLIDFIHAQRCGDHRDHLRGPCHLDDGRRSDNGRLVDATGGWHDAGDTRKWMHHSTQPILGLSAWAGREGGRLGRWRAADGSGVIEEIAWGAAFVLRMQDPETGMIWEDVGGGGDARKRPGMCWWYDNLSGCYADNSDNRFTSNCCDGGERVVRTTYNPLVQYVNILVLVRAAASLEVAFPDLARRCLEASTRVWTFVDGRRDDPFHRWTSVRSWRLQGALALCRAGCLPPEAVFVAADALMRAYDEGVSWWKSEQGGADFYRGVLSSAQPLLALADVLRWECCPHEMHRRIRGLLEATWEGHVGPMLSATPYGIMPYGIYAAPDGTQERYHSTGRPGCWYRCFMPDGHDHGIRLGINGHLTSWAHGLAAVGTALGDHRWTEAAWDQLQWLLGCNPFAVSQIEGIGYGCPMPHSRFLGQLSGGVINGLRGDREDRPVLDLERRADWSTCEYWLPLAANALQALAVLVPGSISDRVSLGCLPEGRV